jgi:membrane protease YdiL (CAAX protease family)
MRQNIIALAGVTVAIIATLGLLCLSLSIGQKNHHDVGLYFLYQGMTLGIAGAVLLLVKVMAGDLRYLKIGDMGARSRPIKLLGIKETETWKSVGATFAVIISLMTGLFLFFASKNSLTAISLQSWIMAFGLSIPLACSNAFVEEVITRWAIVESMAGRYVHYAPWLSAAIFGSVHYFGTPGGLIGSMMAGFLGWLLARSIQDTGGIGWAWFIHFLQDVLIFTFAIAMFI